MKSRSLKLHDELFDIDHHLIVGSLTYLQSYANKNLEDVKLELPENASGGCFPLIMDSGVFGCVIWLPSLDMDKFDMVVVSHECLHASIAVYKHFWVQINYEDLGEHLAYYQGYLIRNLLTLCK